MITPETEEVLMEALARIARVVPFVKGDTALESIVRGVEELAKQNDFLEHMLSALGKKS